MTRIRTVTVGPHRYDVIYDKTEIYRISSDGEPKLGETDTKQCRIYVDPDQAPSQIADTLLHEALHALFDLIGASEAISHDQEERVVRSLSPALISFLRANERLLSVVLGSP